MKNYLKPGASEVVMILLTYTALALALGGSIETPQPRSAETEISMPQEEIDLGGMKVIIQVQTVPLTPKEAQRVSECCQLPLVGAFADYCYGVSDDLVTPYSKLFQVWDQADQYDLSELEKNCHGQYQSYPLELALVGCERNVEDLIKNCSGEYREHLSLSQKINGEGKKLLLIYSKDPQQYHQELLDLGSHLKSLYPDGGCD